MTYRLVIFDFDGTLADSFPWFADIFNQVAERYRFRRIAPDDVDLLRGFDAQKLRRHLGVSWWKIPLIARHVRSLMASDIQRIALFDGVEPLLRSLAADGVTLAVVSSNSTSNVLKVLGPRNAALISYFECGVSLFGKKAKFRQIVKKSGIPPSEALCVGDEIRDIQAAKRANLASGAVTWGFARPESLRAQSPTEVFASLEGIREVVIPRSRGMQAP